MKVKDVQNSDVASLGGLLAHMWRLGWVSAASILGSLLLIDKTLLQTRLLNYKSIHNISPTRCQTIRRSISSL